VHATHRIAPETLHAAVLRVPRERFIPPPWRNRWPSNRFAGQRRQKLSAADGSFPSSRRRVTGANCERLHSRETITPQDHLMEKLGAENNAELIRYAIEHKLFD